MKLTTNQINKLKGQTFLNCWSEGGIFRSMCINKLKKDYIDISIKMIYKKIKKKTTMKGKTTMFNNLKKQQGIVPITVNHYGWFGSDYSFGNKIKDYRDWIEQTHNIKWDEYQSGIICDDQTMLWEFLQYKKIDHKYEFVFDEDSNGFFLIEKQQKEVA